MCIRDIPWITPESWLTRTERHFEVPFKDFTVTSTMYDIDVPGYQPVSYTHLVRLSVF